jgi:2-aminoadipate transaminase
MKLALNRQDSIPLYRQVAQRLRELMENGTLSAGARLPTVRKLADDHGLTRLTVQSAYGELQDQGWIQSVVGRGTFVAERQRPRPAAPQPRLEISGSLAELLQVGDRPARFKLAQATPGEDTYPLKELKSCLGHALAQEGTMGYGPLQGEESLRSAFSRLLLTRGVSTAPEHILVTHGAQQGMDLAFRALSLPDQPVMVEVPVYPGALELLRSRNQPCLEVPLNNLAAVEEFCRRHRPPLLYTIPCFQNPTGLVSSPETREGLLQLAQRYDFYIVEDDVWGFLAYDDSPPPPLKSSDAGNRVIYVTSVSKTLTPGLRLGAVVAPPEPLATMTQLKHACDLICSSLHQRALAEFLRRGAFDPHLQSVIRTYRDRRDALMEAIQTHLPECECEAPGGGLSAWLRLPAGCDETDIFRQAKEEGLLVTRGQAFYASHQVPGCLRLSFGTHKPRALQQAIALLGQIVEQSRRRTSLLRQRVRLNANPLV